MAQPTYSADAIVLKKTKLGEADLLLTLIARDGSQLRAVAKGARKPGGAFAGKLEVCNRVHLLCSQGRSLDIVKEARLDAARPALAADAERAACAACAAELAERLTQPELEHPRMFDLLDASFAALAEARGATMLYLCAATLLKLFAFAGIMPQLDRCAICDGPAPATAGRVAFSIADGGAVCAACAAAAEAYPVDADVLALAASLLMATFDSIAATPADEAFAQRVLAFCDDWSRFHVGAKLRSLDFLLSLTA